jgi:hypothetical protein
LEEKNEEEGEEEEEEKEEKEEEDEQEEGEEEEEVEKEVLVWLQWTSPPSSRTSAVWWATPRPPHSSRAPRRSTPRAATTASW